MHARFIFHKHSHCASNLNKFIFFSSSCICCANWCYPLLLLLWLVLSFHVGIFRLVEGEKIHKDKIDFWCLCGGGVVPTACVFKLKLFNIYINRQRERESPMKGTQHNTQISRLSEFNIPDSLTLFLLSATYTECPCAKQRYQKTAVESIFE